MPIFSLFREFPPSSRRFSAHEAGDGYEHIDHARIMLGIRQCAKTFIHLVRAHANELLRFGNAKQQKICFASFANVGQICKQIEPISGDLTRVHGVVPDDPWENLNRANALVNPHHSSMAVCVLNGVRQG